MMSRGDEDDVKAYLLWPAVEDDLEQRHEQGLQRPGTLAFFFSSSFDLSSAFHFSLFSLSLLRRLKYLQPIGEKGLGFGDFDIGKG